MRFVGVFNRDGGALGAMDVEAFCADAVAIFAARGHQLECRPTGGSEIVAALEAAATAGADAMLVGGGDGTISTAADIAWRHQMPLAVLPAGTMNLFARSLQMPMELVPALEAVAGGKIGEVDIATANGRAFVHHFGVGIHTRMVRIRNGLAYRGRLGKMAASLRAMAAAVIRPPRFTVDFHTASGSERRLASGVSVSNNPLDEGHLPHADALDRGVLGVYAVEPLSSWALVRLFAALLVGRWKGLSEISEREVHELVLTFPRRKRSDQAVIDGELIALEKRVELTIHPRGLKVVLPAPAAP